MTDLSVTVSGDPTLTNVLHKYLVPLNSPIPFMYVIICVVSVVCVSCRVRPAAENTVVRVLRVAGVSTAALTALWVLEADCFGGGCAHGYIL